MLAFLGDVVACLPKLLRGAARFRRTDFFIILQECGVQALPIVSLISFLVGVILAYVGAIQLRQFGAQVYVADLVGLEVVEQGGERLGLVEDVLPGPANDALELDTGRLLPLVEDCVLEVDLTARRVLVARGFAGDG
jgi:hypothetical protein